MAFAAELASLTEELVEAVTGSVQLSPQTKKRLQDDASRTLRSHAFLRTNQFEIENALTGLEERFRINDRDGLADELQERRSTLAQQPAPWHPEMLSLLLELSDQPVFHTRSDCLDDLYPEESQLSAQNLLWEDIAREDDWEADAAIWDSIKYSDSSDEETFRDDTVDSISTRDTTDTDIAAARRPEDLVIQSADETLLRSIQDAQAWRHGTREGRDDAGNRKIGVAELQVVHEVLFMLQGLATSIFDDSCSGKSRFQTEHLLWDTHKALINTFSEYGRQLSILRRFVRLPQAMPHLQAFQDSIEQRLRGLDDEITAIQQRLADAAEDVVVSLAALNQELNSTVDALLHLANLVENAERSAGSNPFRFLDALYDGATAAQLEGRDGLYEFLARIFLESFNIYLEPVRDWMCEGKLTPEDEIFFVSEAAENVTMGKIWRDGYLLRQNAEGTLLAPVFLRTAAHKIFNTGKAIVVLKRLGKFKPPPAYARSLHLAFETVCPSNMKLAPFPNLFEMALARWIQSGYGQAPATLRQIVQNEQGLAASLHALRCLHLNADGAASADFCESLFTKMDSGNRRWNDQYLLTGLAQDVFSHCLDPARISIKPSQQQIGPEEAAASVRSALPQVHLVYRPPWTVQMIISDQSLVHYQAIATLLLQLRRTMYVLNEAKIPGDQGMTYYACRRNLLWFCTTVQTYLATLVLQPNVLQLQRDMERAAEIDAMIATHDDFTKRIVDEACLGSRLAPIHNALLDVLDLALLLERSRTRRGSIQQEQQPYEMVLERISSGFDKHLRFICEGLRSVARATGDSKSAKWSIMAEMLEAGRRDVVLLA